MGSSTRRLFSGLTRRGAGAALLAVAFAPRAKAAPCAPPRVLFVCPVGTVKSAIARETLRRQAGLAHMDVHVESRGLHPENHVSPALAEHLQAEGINPAADPLRALTEADVKTFDVVIAFDDAALDPSLRGARRWETPSWNDHYDEAKAALAAQIDQLLIELRRRNDRTCEGAPHE